MKKLPFVLSILTLSLLMPGCKFFLKKPVKKPSQVRVQKESTADKASASIEKPSPSVTQKAAADQVLLAKEALDQEKFDQAQWHLRQAIRVSPTYGPAYYWLARISFLKNQTSQAKLYLMKAKLYLGHLTQWQSKLAILDKQINGV